APGEVAKTFFVPILDDALLEGDETVSLNLTNATAGGVLNLALATLTIVDDERAAGEFNFSSPLYTVNEYDLNVTITVTRTNGSSGLVSVHYSTIDGTANAGQDYTATSGILSFGDAETAKTFTIPIAPDHIP